MTEDIWMAEEEDIYDQFTDEAITEKEARDRLKKLGLDPDEIDEYIDFMMIDMGLT
jgi:hypothetical protein